jgi:hypothetical protein
MGSTSLFETTGKKHIEIGLQDTDLKACKRKTYNTVPKGVYRDRVKEERKRKGGFKFCLMTLREVNRLGHAASTKK